MPFTPDERVPFGEADPVTRVIGHTTSNIVLADEADYLLDAYAEGTYRVSFQDEAVYPLGGRFDCEITFPNLIETNGQGWGIQSDGSASADTNVRVASLEYDHTGGNISQELLVVTVAAHNLQVGQFVSLVMDSDLTGSTAFATGSTIAALDDSYVVAFVGGATTFSVEFTPGTVNDAADGTLDANLYINPVGAVSYRKVVTGIKLIDGESSAGVCGDWDGDIIMSNVTADLNGRFVVDAGAVDFNVDQWEATGLVDWDTDGSDASQGVEIASNVLNVYNENASTEEYILTLSNPPLQGVDVNLHVCLFSTTGSQLTLSNRLGRSTPFSITRVA